MRRILLDSRVFELLEVLLVSKNKVFDLALRFDNVARESMSEDKTPSVVRLGLFGVTVLDIVIRTIGYCLDD